MEEAPEYGDEDPILSANIRKLMLGRNITSIGKLREAMAEAGYPIGNSTIQRALKGGTGNRLESLEKFAAFFDVTSDQLLQPELGRDADPQAKGDVYEKPTADEWAMLQNYRMLRDKDQKRLAEEMSELAGERQADFDEFAARFGVKGAVQRANARKTSGDRATVDPADPRLKQKPLPGIE